MAMGTSPHRGGAGMRPYPGRRLLGGAASEGMTMERTRGTRTGRAGMLALLGALTLVLGACSLPHLPGRSGPDLASQDVITLSRANAGIMGYFGEWTTEVAADTITMTYQLPNDAVISTVTEELSPAHREAIVQATEEYVAWEKTLSERERTPCTDIPSTTVTISGSLTHDSSVQDCEGETPLRTLTSVVRDAQSPRSREVARPTHDWTIEIRPWSGEGPDESADVERYHLSAAEPEEGMAIEAENAPAGWGAGLAEDEGDGAPLGWDATGTVLIVLNDFLQGQDQLGCGDPVGEIRAIQHDTPSQTWAYRLCPGQQSEALVDVLRGL